MKNHKTVIRLYESKNKDGEEKTKSLKKETKTTFREGKKLSKNQDYP